MRGLGVKSVDLRGIRSPAAATAATASTGVGLSSSAVPERTGRGKRRRQVVPEADHVLGVRESPHPAHQQVVGQRDVERAPCRRAVGRERAAAASGLGIGEQPRVLLVGHAEGRPLRSGLREARPAVRRRGRWWASRVKALAAACAAAAAGRLGITR